MYETLARYYDQIHASLTVDLPFILKMAEEQGGPLLELGSGTGRLLIPLAEAGFQITGIDNSPEMLEIARRRLAKMPASVQQSVTLLEEDILSVSRDAIDQRFALTLLSYNTLLHFNDLEIGRLLRGLAGLMQPGGRMLIDIANPFLVAGATYTQVPLFEASFIDEMNNERVEQWSVSSLDENTQTLTVTWTFQAADGDTKTQVVEIAYHYHYPHQVDLLLQQAGFKLETIWGDYEEAPFDENSERLLMLASLPG